MDWKTVAHELGAKLFRYFLVSFPRSISQELTQETLLRLVRYHNNGKIIPSKGSPDMVAFGIARNVKKETYAALEKENRLKNLAAMETDYSIASEPKDEVDSLRNAVVQLPEAERQVVELLIDKDLSLAEISSILGMPLGTVKSHIYRAKQFLRRLLVKTGGIYG